MNVYFRRITTLKRKRVSVRILTLLALGLKSRTEKTWVTSFTVCEGDYPSTFQGAQTQKDADREHENLVQMMFLMGFKQTHDGKDMGWVEPKEKSAQTGDRQSERRRKNSTCLL